MTTIELVYSSNRSQVHITSSHPREVANRITTAFSNNQLHVFKNSNGYVTWNPKNVAIVRVSQMGIRTLFINLRYSTIIPNI